MSDSDFINPVQHNQDEVLFDSGGTCDCYRLVKDNRVYCVKRPKKDMRSSEAYMNLFRKEFELGIELEHPNIVRYFTYDEDEQGPFIRMDYIDGDSLEAFVAQHPDYFKDKGHRKQFCDELFSALSYLHDKKMLHLNLKPSNILITNKGHHVRLIDLGFGWSESYLHDLGFTREYCAPEQQTAKTELFSPATDIYALIGQANDSISQTNDGWIDLFGYGTSGYDHGAVNYQPWSTFGVDSDYCAYGDLALDLNAETGQADWGYNAILNGSNREGLWRTLTGEEWEYVLFQRNTSSGVRKPSSATIQSIPHGGT